MARRNTLTNDFMSKAVIIDVLGGLSCIGRVTTIRHIFLSILNLRPFERQEIEVIHNRVM